MHRHTLQYSAKGTGSKSSRAVRTNIRTTAGSAVPPSNATAAGTHVAAGATVGRGVGSDRLNGSKSGNGTASGSGAKTRVSVLPVLLRRAGPGPAAPAPRPAGFARGGWRFPSFFFAFPRSALSAGKSSSCGAVRSGAGARASAGAALSLDPRTASENDAGCVEALEEAAQGPPARTSGGAPEGLGSYPARGLGDWQASHWARETGLMSVQMPHSHTYSVFPAIGSTCGRGQTGVQVEGQGAGVRTGMRFAGEAGGGFQKRLPKRLEVVEKTVGVGEIWRLPNGGQSAWNGTIVAPKREAPPQFPAHARGRKGAHGKRVRVGRGVADVGQK